MNSNSDTSPPLLVESADGSAPDELVVCLQGEVDLLTHRSLRSALDDIEQGDAMSIRLELSGLRFCDSHGARMLNAFARSLRVAGRRVALESPSPMVRRLLDMFDVSLRSARPSERLNRAGHLAS